MATTQSKHGRKFDEEFKREAATLASQPGRRDEEVARDLGVSAGASGPAPAARDLKEALVIFSALPR